MIVSEICELDKKRCRVYLEGEFAFILYKGEIRDLCIRQGEELSEDVYREIMESLLPKRCKLRAMNLLQKRDYTERQLRDKLSEGLYPAEIIDDAVDYVKSFRYIDDDRYARDYIAYHMSTRSRNRILQDLMTKGIPRDSITAIMDEVYAEEGDVEMEQIRQLLDKKHFDPDNTDYKERQKITAFLMRRGFSLSQINKAMRED